MKSREVYCSTAEAAALLGMRPWEVTAGVADGSLTGLTETVHTKKKSLHRLLRSEVLKAAGLTEWPSEIDTASDTMRADLAARDLREAGLTPEQMATVGEILFRHRVITRPQFRRIAG